VPDRDDVEEFAATLNVTMPFPVPELPPVIVMKDALLTAVQEQPACVRTLKLPVPPLAPNDWGTDGERVYVHDGPPANAAVSAKLPMCPAGFV
jgi:hypothetical protein